MKWKPLFFFLATLLGWTQVSAAPIGFKDSTMVMVDVSTSWKDVSANYAFTNKDALGGERLTMRSDDKSVRRDASMLTYTRLAKRWNLPSAQANLWLFGNVGTVTGSDFVGTKTLLSPGFQADYETRRVYAAATWKQYKATDLQHNTSSVRTGFSFYETSYDEVQPWLILEAKRVQTFSERTELTPMVRLIAKNFFVEFGRTVSPTSAQQTRVNFMYTF